MFVNKLSNRFFAFVKKCFTQMRLDCNVTCRPIFFMSVKNLGSDVYSLMNTFQIYGTFQSTCILGLFHPNKSA